MSKTGTYLNPSNKGFAESLRSEIYVDKSGLISYTNRVLNTEQKYVCVSRPRRFGKTMAAKMLAAYYVRNRDSREMFTNLFIANDKSYMEHLNKYNVIFLDMQQFLSESNDICSMVAKIKNKLIRDITKLYSDLYVPSFDDDLTDILHELYTITDVEIVFIIDEWDCVFRKHRTDKYAQEDYLDFLRTILKTKDYIALVYMTGILPIKKYGDHSALNMFDEFSMTDPEELAEFVGFTQNEVIRLCKDYERDYSNMVRWYDGYYFTDIGAVFNPRSVVRSILSKRYKNYWTRTETYEALSIYFSMNFDGLKDVIIQLLSGEKKKINIGNFSNDMVTFKTYEDILTLLIHLGYLGYNTKTMEVFVPNKEIFDEFEIAIKDTNWKEIINAINISYDLLKATWRGDTKTVAQMIDCVHDESSHLQYNNENSLSQVIDSAYFSAKEFYDKIREIPAGKGFADIVFKPKSNHIDKPAMLVELKWDKSADAAIKQIKNKKYPKVLNDYKGNILLIGINYNKKSKKHECIIEKV